MFWNKKHGEVTPVETPRPLEFDQTLLVKDLKDRLHLFMNENKEVSGYELTIADINFLSELQGNEALTPEERTALDGLAKIIETRNIGF